LAHVRPLPLRRRAEEGADGDAFAAHRYVRRHSIWSMHRLQQPAVAGSDMILAVFTLRGLCRNAVRFWWAGARE
jgi:hypothetical protein